MSTLVANRAFARFWSAGLCFLLAWWALHAVMLIHVFQLTGSPFATGLIPVFASIPGIVLGPVAGVLVDRWDRQRVMAWSALILVGLMVLTLPLARDVDVSVLYAIIFIQSMVMTFFSPAENALLPTLVPIEDLTTANSLNALNDSLGRIVGPAAGAWTLVQFGFAATLVVSALLYLAGWALLIGIRHERQHVPGPSEAGIRSLVRSVLASFLDGLRFVRERPALFLVVAVFALFMVADVPLTAVLPAFMIESVGVSPGVFGSLMSVLGITGLLGGLLVVVLSRRIHEAHLLVGGLLLYGASILTFGLANNLVGSVFVLIPIGPAAAAIQTGLFTMLQKATPDAMRGRVFALTGTINGLIVLVVSFTAGSLGEAFGTRVIVIASGCLHILPLLLLIALLQAKHAVARQA